MKALVLQAEWEPKSGYVPTESERQSRRVLRGSQVWKHPRIELKNVAEPNLKDDEVMLEVRAVGICGSDMHMYETSDDGYMLYPSLVKTSNILGHEFSGRVVELGKEVQNLKVDDFVAVEELQWCGGCTSCRRGFFNHCEKIEEIGFSIPGALATYIAVKAKYCWKLDDLIARVGEEEAMILGAMVEPTGVAYQGMFNRLTTWRPGYHTVIFGAGPIGLATTALAVAAGAGEVIVFDTSKPRRDFAMAMGASHTADPKRLDLDNYILDITSGHGADWIVECSGAAEQTLQGLNTSLAVNASIIDIGMGRQKPTLPTVTYKVKGVQFAGSLGHVGSGTFHNVIRLMAAGRIDMRRMLSDTLPLDDAVAAFKRLESREDAKLILLPQA